MSFFTYDEIDELGEGLIRQYLGPNAERARRVDIEGLVRNYLKLPLLYCSFAEHYMAKIGFIADGFTPLHIVENGKPTERVFAKETIVIENCLRQKHESGRRRFTISHESAHYVMDRTVQYASFHREFDRERVYSLEDFSGLFSFEETLIDQMGAALLIRSNLTADMKHCRGYAKISSAAVILRHSRRSI